MNMMTSSNGTIFRVTGPLCGEFTGPGEFSTQRPLTRSFDDFFDLRLNKRLSKQPWGWWFATPSWSLWRQCNEGNQSPNVVWGWQQNVELCCTAVPLILSHILYPSTSDSSLPLNKNLFLWFCPTAYCVYSVKAKFILTSIFTKLVL